LRRRRRTALNACVLALLCVAGPATLAAQPAESTITVIVVRHAEKADDSRDPPLSDAGTRRAEMLAGALAHAGITTIITTQYRRTRDTAAPLARSIGIEPEVVEAGSGTASSIEGVATRVRSLLPGSVALVVGHSNTVAEIILALGGPDVGHIEDDEYSALFVVQLRTDGTRLIRSRY
jgi:phosphohistidine phosphatase SixA